VSELLRAVRSAPSGARMVGTLRVSKSLAV